MPHNHKPLAVTMGEPAGVGPELTLKAWRQRDALKLPAFCYIGCATHLKRTSEHLGLKVPLVIVDEVEKTPQIFAEALPVLDCKLSHQVTPGHPHISNAKAVTGAIETAVTLTLKGLTRAVVTNPIHKKTMHDAGFPFPGHTEYLAHLAGGEHASIHPVMMLTIPGLKVVPVTVHLPLAQVGATLSQEIITHCARITVTALRQDFGITAPRLTVAAFNPHAGEGGQLGREEIDVIAPAVRSLRAEGIQIEGPYPADTLFSDEARQTCDAILCMYHDQALIPLKTIDFHRGVNVTLGLPFVRTSPDHGTAFNIAGQDIARPDSFIEALTLADEIANRRSVA